MGGATCGAGVDYVSTNGTLSFLPADVTKQITVNVCGDPFVESNETFFVNLSNPTNATSTDDQGLGTIQNDDTPPNTVYVDDDFTGPVGSDPDGAGPASAIGFDAFNTIQGGINAVATGGTVNVAAGNYFENPAVNRAMTLLGANANIAGSGVRGAESNVRTNGNQTAVFSVTAANVQINGFLIDGDDPAV